MMKDNDLTVNVCFKDVSLAIHNYKTIRSSFNLRNLYFKMNEFYKFFAQRDMERLRKFDHYKYCRVSLSRQHIDLQSQLHKLVVQLCLSMSDEDKNVNIDEVSDWYYKCKSYLDHYSRCKSDSIYRELGGES